MQKKIIALAVAGLVSGVAFAQSNVTVYGIADAGIGSWSAGSNKNQRTTGVMTGGMSAARLGFKGEEALGNGLKAIFNFETAVSQDPADEVVTDTDPALAPGAKFVTKIKNQSGWGSNRQANVGLTGNFGTVLLGKQSSMSDKWHGGAGADYMGNLAARNLFKNSGDGAVRGGFAQRKPNSAVSYVSPTFSGFTVGGIVAFDDEGGAKTGTAPNLKKDRQTMYQIGANYANGPIKAAVTYAIEDYSVGKDPKEWTVAATYDFKVVQLYASYEAVRKSGTTKKNDDNATWQLGLGVPVSANGTIKLGYAATDNEAKKADVKAYQIGYEHNLSKRTNLYASYARLSNDKAANYTPHGRYQNQSEYSAQNDKNYNGLMMGIRHTF